ncbi:MAG: hypothetical protein K2X03_30415 [Bryobacteraceae bacterium]|nr:hypothetical protein [Bryobacteraceae bacterium]
MPSGKYFHPALTLALPFFALTALIAGPAERRLPIALLSSSVYALMTWLFPRCRWRREHYFCPVNVALGLFLLKLVVGPILIMLTGPESSVLSILPTYSTMQGAILIDVIAYVAFCLGLTYAPREFRMPRSSALSSALLHSPSQSFIWLFAVVGIFGFVSAFDSIPRLVEYFVDPAQSAITQQDLEGTWQGLLGTVLRPFFAFSLIAWWARTADHASGALRPALTGFVAALGITLANITFSFNRAAFMFPLLCLAAVYNARIRRIPFGFTTAGLAMLLPVLIAIGAYRSGENTSNTATQASSFIEISENLQAYGGGPQFTGLFYDRIGWSERPFGGSTLLASVMSPVPVLGKGFRESSGPALFNAALDRGPGVEDQIIPFATELFANFHLPGVIAGFALLAYLLSQAELWFSAARSTFTAFAIQYAALWAAMLAAWSAAIYSQILIYFFLPIYFYLGYLGALTWLKSFNRRSPLGAIS